MKHFVSGVFSVLLAFPAIAECAGENLSDHLSAAERAELDEQVAMHPYPAGNIWRAEKPDSTVHIIGTFHLFDPRTRDIIEAAHDLLENADRAFFEVLDEDEQYLQAQLVEDLEIGFITDGPTLPELLTDEEWSELQRRMNEYNMPGFFVAKMQPWFIGLTMAFPPCVVRKVEAANGVDPVLRKIAAAAGTPMQALDDIDDLIILLSKGSIEEQVADLKIAMTMTNDFFEDQHRTNLDLYLEGKHRELLEFGKLWALKTNPDHADHISEVISEALVELLDDRNAEWMKTLLPAIVNGTYVVAVGAGHLSGNSGILNQLERAGYILTPVIY